MTRKLQKGQVDTQNATEDYRNYLYTYDLGAAALSVEEKGTKLPWQALTSGPFGVKLTL